LQVKIQLKKKEFIEQEARVRYNAYQEILAHVARFCDRNGIQLVLRFSGDEMDPNNAQSVQAGLMREIVFQREPDITQYIVSALSQGRPPENLGNRPQIPRR
jgi:hypothetical protein